MRAVHPPIEQESSLTRVIQRGWGCDVSHNATQACFIGDCDFGMIRFRQSLPRGEVEAAARLIDQAPRMLLELQLHWVEGECYCLKRSEGGNACGVCAHCSTGQLLKSLGGRRQLRPQDEPDSTGQRQADCRRA